MTDTAGDNSPFTGFPGFPPAEMLDKMWDMMRLTPFGAAFPGMQPGSAQGFTSPLTAMSDMMSPLMSVEELDKRITDMRAVEQWLKLNLSMLQSAIQALEVQRATLSTLRAFGAFAQASMTQPSDAAGRTGAQPSSASTWGAAASRPAQASDAGASERDTTRAEAAAGEQSEAEAEAGDASAAFDPSGWWNLLQSQFNQLAAFAMTQPGAAADSEPASKPAKKTGGAQAQRAKSASASSGAAARDGKPAAQRAPARKRAAKPAGSPGSGTTRGEK